MHHYLSSVLRKCASSSAIFQAKQSHCQVNIRGLISDVTLQTDVLLAYCKCGSLRYARMVFDKMPERNMHSWNILISNYVSSCLFSEAITAFRMLVKMGFRADHYTWPAALKACSGMCDVYMGKVLHCWVIRLGFHEYKIVGTSVLDFYLKIGDLFDARKVFLCMSWKDSVVWNTMISGFGRAGLYKEALNIFRNMIVEGVRKDSMTVAAVLNACAGEGDLIKGKEMHAQVVKSVVFETDIVVLNSLIDMYAKCGCLLASENVFNMMSNLNLVTWTTMISCYGIHGRGDKALLLFKKMKDNGFIPNSVTLTAILACCSHSGLIDEGRRIFNSISSDYGFEPSVEHYACMVDLLGRCGYLEEALELVDHKELGVTPSVWGALLAGCVVHKNDTIGEIAAGYLFELEPRNTSNYIALCHIYDSLGLKDKVLETRKKMRNLSLIKTPGCSWITVAGKTKRFYGGDCSNTLAQIVCKTLDEIIKSSMFIHITSIS